MESDKKTNLPIKPIELIWGWEKDENDNLVVVCQMIITAVDEDGKEFKIVKIAKFI